MLIEPSNESLLPQLAQLLTQGFAYENGLFDYANQDALRWKFFADRGYSFAPRSLICRDQDQIVAHMGLSTTAFCATTTTVHSPATHITDWVAFERGGGWGGLLMLKSFDFSQVQYAFGSTTIATQVLLKGGFKEIQYVPLFHKILARAQPAAWRLIHGKQRLPKQLALLAVDGIQSIYGAFRRPSRGIEATPTSSFGHETQEIINRCSFPVTFTSRAPALLNYYLACPTQPISGWLLNQHNNLRGFALTTVLHSKNLRIGRIVDCFLDSTDPSLWRAAIAALEEKLINSEADVISSYGSSPWFAYALKQNGFFRRGRTTFFLRDRKGLVPRNGPFHLTHLEADLAYI